MVDETAEGSPFAALRMREADYDKHLTNGERRIQRAKRRAKKPSSAGGRIPQARCRAPRARVWF